MPDGGAAGYCCTLPDFEPAFIASEFMAPEFIVSGVALRDDDFTLPDFEPAVPESAFIASELALLDFMESDFMVSEDDFAVPDFEPVDGIVS